ncbi:MAG: GxxExxY protein [Caldilineaceae bacterium]|nr:GxxExxY protein [Caldilineaceae bacterium]MBP8109289.1 GxxExxY protein [Caldilineaceae bacterium]MBP8123600.1 GxxExxY protein [Caldilineaceae bacterium]MBP9073654.1 GxxExxY protein [Caldilineaceae bacterium]
MVDLLLKDEVYAVVGAAMAVYNELGPGFLEAVYHEALEIELRLREIPFASHAPLTVSYKGVRLAKHYEADVIAYGQVVVELKALSRLTTTEQAQLLNYLKATGHRVGVLINFGHPDDLQWKRMIK